MPEVSGEISVVPPSSLEAPKGPIARNELGLVRFIPSPEDERNIQNFQEQVRTNIDIDNIAHEAPVEARDRMSKVIAETVYECSNLLGLPIPEVGLPEGLQEIGYLMQSPSIVAMGGLRNKVIDGEIETTPVVLVSPFRLERVVQDDYAQGEMSANLADENIRGVIAHELYELRSALKYPRLWHFSQKPLKNPDMGRYDESWWSKRTELAAETFSYRYLKDRETEGWREKVAKTVNLLDLQEEIAKMRLMRLGKLDSHSPLARIKPFSELARDFVTGMK